MKQELRRAIRKSKSRLSKESSLAQSVEIFRQVEQLPEFRNARVVLCYWSLPDEVYTHEFLEMYFRKKHFVLPVISGVTLQLKTFNGREAMRREKQFGVMEPVGEPYKGSVDMAIIPGVAFDRNNNRLGRGKGFYDRLLSSLACFKVGVGFDFQLLETIPVDNHDRPMDIVISP